MVASLSVDRRVGVLALQGSFREHLEKLTALGVSSRAVKRSRDLEGLEGLILPGGESTALVRLASREGLLERISAAGRAGLPLFGTCAGLVLLAQIIENSSQPRLGLLDVTVRRNGFGGQLESFETRLALDLPGQPGVSFHGVFIRAPQILRVGGGVTVLARLPDDGIAAVRRNNLLAASFHPELTGDLRLHRYFLGMVEEYAQAAPGPAARFGLLEASSR